MPERAMVPERSEAISRTECIQLIIESERRHCILYIWLVPEEGIAYVRLVPEEALHTVCARTNDAISRRVRLL